ncbi:MAG: LL-diaminopimelate aminotransferase [Candidatus Avispirillum sp.]
MKIKLNDNYRNLSESYLFSEIARRVREYKEAEPEKGERIVRLGIGDVTLPLAPAVVSAMEAAVREMGDASTFRGYPPEYGYDFLREAISSHYASFGVKISPEDIFVSDGAKSDVGNIVDILGDNTVYIPDPVYPVYLDSNVMSGRRIEFIPGNEKNGFLPMPDGIKCEGAVFYLCSPNNPTGAVYDREKLRVWVDFALRTGSLIIFDSAYEAFVTGDLPHSIYEIEGAEKCAVEICSFSKTAGFTGTRCAWCVVPSAAMSGGMSLNKMWRRRQATKFNGVSYPVQRAAEAALSPEGLSQCMENIAYYMENARIISNFLDRKGISYTGGRYSPYVWLKCPDGMSSWEFFDYLLTKAQVVGTPGEGFGSCGEGYFRLTSFGSREGTEEAVRRLEELL